MLWTLWDILIPLLVTFILGLGLGWLLWRWRRRQLQASELAQPESRATQQMNAGATAQELQAANEKVSLLSTDLQRERNSNQQLSAELDKARLEATAHADSAAEVVATRAMELEVNLQVLQGEHDRLQQQLGECSSVNQQHQQRIQSLEADLQRSRQATESAQQSVAESQMELQALQAQSVATAVGVAGHLNLSTDAEVGEANDARIRELERQLDEANAQLSEAAGSINPDLLQQREAELSEREAELEAAQLELKATAEQRAELIELREKLASQPDAVDEEARARQLQMAAQRERDQQTELTAAREQLQERDARIATLEGSIARLSNVTGSSRADPGGSVSKSAGSAAFAIDGFDDSPARAESLDTDDSADLAAASNAASATAAGKAADTVILAEEPRLSSSSASADGRSLTEMLAADSALLPSPSDEPSTVDRATARAAETPIGELTERTEAESGLAADDDSATMQPLTGLAGQSADHAECTRTSAAGESSLAVGGAAVAEQVPVATVSGYVPSGWQVPASVPDKSERDELTTIKGVGPKLEGVLHNNGIYYFRQVALLNAAGIDELQEQMPEFRGRIQRDNWVSQAAELHRQKYGAPPK